MTGRFFAHQDAVASLRYVSGTKLDERIIRCDLDPGYLENRQYGRGRSGGQVRDEYREDWDGQSFTPLSSGLDTIPRLSSVRILNDLFPRDRSALTSPSSFCSRNRGARSRSRRLGSPQEPGRDGSATATRSRGHVPVRSRRERCRARSPDRSGNARRGECFPVLLACRLGLGGRQPRGPEPSSHDRTAPRRRLLTDDCNFFPESAFPRRTRRPRRVKGPRSRICRLPV